MARHENDFGYPLFFALTTHKNEKTYYEILNYLKRNIAENKFDLNNIILTTDFERGLLKTVKAWFPEIKIIGYAFHFINP